MAVPKARKKGIIDFFYFSQPEDETVLCHRQILKLNTYSSPETSALDQESKTSFGQNCSWVCGAPEAVCPEQRP